MTKLLCIFIDGLQVEALECAHVRCIKQLMASGCTAKLTHDGPNLTLPGMSTLFSSLPPREHGVTTNNSGLVHSLHAVSLLTLAHYAHRTLSFFFSREHLQHLFSQGVLQTSMFINSQGVKNVDNELAQHAAHHLQWETPDLCCIHFQGTDIAGTHFGYLSEPYLESIERVDRALDMLLDKLQMVGLQDEYTIVITASYGGLWASDPHGQAPQLELPFIVRGPGINQNHIIRSPRSFLDAAPTLASILDIAPHPNWQGSVAEELFTSKNNQQTGQDGSLPVHLLDNINVRSAA